MTTEETVKRLVELVAEGKNVQAEEELYADDVVSYEQSGSVTTGKEAVIAKTKASGEYFEALHSGAASAAFINQDSFLLIFDMDFTPKGGERMQMKEYGFYRVNAEGQVAEEYFYGTPLAL